MPTDDIAQERGFTISLACDAAREVALAGSKAASLARLGQAQLPVPPGFVLTTAAYDAFIDAHHLLAAIDDRLATVDPRDSGALEAASTDIRALFGAHPLPAAIERAALAAWDRLATPLVAVRSSATTEDLPAHSFAGQHDSFLNVAGPRGLLRAIVDCWSSLWTPRAIAYRAEHAAGSRPPRELKPPRDNKQKLPADRDDCRAGASAPAHDSVSMAVLVQTMVAAEYAGVAFTANPITGRRHEIVIEAVRGLGDALVSGAVVPAQFVVDRDRPVRRSDQQSTAAGGHGGPPLHDDSSVADGVSNAPPSTVGAAPRGRPSVRSSHVGAAPRGGPHVPDAVVEAAADLAHRVADIVGEPQDVEWAWTGERAFLLQARPITSLFPLPDDPLAATRPGLGDGRRAYVSFGAIQGMLDPMTPLGRDTIRGIFSGAQNLFGLGVTWETERVLVTAGERLWLDVTPLVAHRVGRRLLAAGLSLMEPAIGGIVRETVVPPTAGGGAGFA